MTAAYIDVAAILSGNFRPPETSVGGVRGDGTRLLYGAAVNVLLGAPEAGKTLVAGVMAADELHTGGRVLWIDLDHNGAGPLLTRFRQFGVSVDLLCDDSRFRLAIPEDVEALLAVIRDDWAPSLAVVDSIGELLPMFGANSNNADEFTAVNRQTLSALASRGVGVLAIDHEAKSSESAAYGAGGTMAKKRAVDGALLRVVNVKPFRPGHSGEARLTIVKDRHGFLRSLADNEREPVISGFTLEPRGDALLARFPMPTPKQTPDEALAADVALVMAMDPLPTAYRQIEKHFRWRGTRAQAAMREFKRLRDASGMRPDASGTPVQGVASVRPTPFRGDASGRDARLEEAIA